MPLVLQPTTVRDLDGRDVPLFLVRADAAYHFDGDDTNVYEVLKSEYAEDESGARLSVLADRYDDAAAYHKALELKERYGVMGFANDEDA